MTLRLPAHHQVGLKVFVVRDDEHALAAKLLSQTVSAHALIQFVTGVRKRAATVCFKSFQCTAITQTVTSSRPSSLRTRRDSSRFNPASLRKMSSLGVPYSMVVRSVFPDARSTRTGTSIGVAPGKIRASRPARFS